MAGKSATLLWTYLTPRRIYRYQVARDDSSPGGTLPVIHADTTSRASGSVAPSGDGVSSGFGSNTTLALSIVKHSGTSAKVNVYMLANAEGVGYAGTPAVYASIQPWVLVYSKEVSVSELINLSNLPAAKYCVTVTDIAGDAVVSILEQHSE